MKLQIALVAVMVGAFGLTLKANSVSAVHSVSPAEAAHVFGGASNPVTSPNTRFFLECNNYVCFDTSKHVDKQQGFCYQGNPDTAGKKACGLALTLSSCSNSGTVKCKTDIYSDLTCTVYENTSTATVANATCN